MANRYDRDPDDYGFGRRDTRDPSREEDDHRQGQYAQGNRGNEGRPGVRPNTQNTNPQSTWRNERDRNEPDYRGRSDQDYRTSTGGRDPRDNNFSDNYYYSGRDNTSGRDYYTSGSERDNRSNLGGYDRSGQTEQQRRAERQASADYRGLYQEQVWTRDPSSGNLYGNEYATRREPWRANAGGESQDRWRSNVNDQNRRFDIDRGWHTPGTSGYGNAGNFQGQTGQGQYGQGQTGQGHYGKGPKGYVRSDERIREDVCDRLSDDDEVDARDITVTVKNAEVILEGSVNDRRSKHRAEDVAESVSGVKEVTNHLRARKGFLQELGDKISGDDDAEHHGHRGSGTRNSTTGPAPAPQKTSH